MVVFIYMVSVSVHLSIPFGIVHFAIVSEISLVLGRV